jgi:TolB protein
MASWGAMAVERLPAAHGASSGTITSLTNTQDDESPSCAQQPPHHTPRAQGRDVLMTTTLDGKIKATLASTRGDVREPIWGPYSR